MTQEKSSKVVFRYNSKGIAIKCCCASCLHKAEYSKEGRVCLKGQGLHRPDFLCSEYAMADRYMRIGETLPGKVKKKDYLLYILDMAARQQKLVEDGVLRADEKMPIEIMAREYERVHGSRYEF